MVNEEVVEVSEIAGSVGDAVRAADLLSKLIKSSKEETSYEDDKARKMKADADIAQKKSEMLDGSNGDITVNINPFEEDS